MRKAIYIVLFLLLGVCTISQAQEFKGPKSKVVVFQIREEIAPAATRLVSKALRTAHEENAELIVIDMDTYGGLVNDADSIRYSILKSKIPVVVYINPNAASAGALISIACERIYMSIGANIGAATVVTQDGEAAPDKYQSYMRSIMRSTAKAHGKIVNEEGDSIWRRHPDIAEAMVDQDIEIEGISEKGKIVTFTPDEAMKYGFCEGIKSSIQEVIEAEGISDYTIINVKRNFIDSIFGFLKNPAVSGILILIILGGIYYELQTPGIGFPIIAAFIGAVLYFAPNYIDGLVEHWELLLFVVGIILLAVELFAIPGFGVVGILGILAIFSSLVLSLIGNDGLNFELQYPGQISSAFLVVSISIIVFIGLLTYSGASLHNSPLLKRISLETSLTEPSSTEDNSEIEINSGDIAITYTDLKPQGRVLFKDKNIVEVSSISGYIVKDTKVRFIRKEGKIWLVDIA